MMKDEIGVSEGEEVTPPATTRLEEIDAHVEFIGAEYRAGRMGEAEMEGKLRALAEEKAGIRAAGSREDRAAAGDEAVLNNLEALGFGDGASALAAITADDFAVACGRFVRAFLVGLKGV